jgi:diguanylate cyclase (GGDEF)-like protein
VSTRIGAVSYHSRPLLATPLQCPTAQTYSFEPRRVDLASPIARMQLQFTPWLLPSTVAVLVCLGVASFAYRRRRIPGAVAMAWTAALAGWWALFQVVGVGLTELDAKVWAAKLQYLGIAPVAVAWLWFGLRFSDREGPRARFVLAALLVPAAATIVLAFTNEWHRLLWADWQLFDGPAFIGLRLEYGPWFRPFQLYSYALTAAGTAVLVWHLAQSRVHRGRIAGVIAAPAVVVGLNLLYQSPFSPPQWVDLTPSGFALGAAILSGTLLRGRLFDMPPVARARILDQLTDGVLVADTRGLILDLNPSAERLLGLSVGWPLPPAIAALLRPAPRTGEMGEGPQMTTFEIEGEPRELEVRTMPWLRPGTHDRFVLVLRDTTERDRMETELRRVNEELSRMNERLQRLARTDGLTGLANRTHLMEAMTIEVLRARRHRRALGLLVLDLDHFKRVNDRFGHPTGDAVLQGTAERIASLLRESDLAARLGGEEFAVLLPETGLEGANVLAERIRIRLAEWRFSAPDGSELGVTASFGVAALSDGMEVADLIQAADAAMYRAKDSGRDRVESATPDPAAG